MKILIAADMEGITGVVDWSHVDSNHPEYKRFRGAMTDDVNAAIRGAFTAGADEVIIADGHGSKTNILIEEIDPRARLNSGTGPLAMVQGIDSGVSALFFIGYHAMAGTQNAILAHTVSGGKIANLWLNGELSGEAGINSVVCGHFGAPVLLASGDRALCAEVRALIPGIDAVETKAASGMSAADCLPPEVTHRRIEEAAEKAVLRFQRGLGPAPRKIEGPVTITVEFHSPVMADRARNMPGARRLDGRRVEVTGETAPLAYQYFRSMMILA